MLPEELPRTIAHVLNRDQAQGILDHLQGALGTSAETVLLYSTLEVVNDPIELHDFPPPDLQTVTSIYVIALGTPYEDYVAQLEEHSDYEDH